MAEQYNKDRLFSKMTGKCIKADLKVLGLPYSTSDIPVEKRREELRSYHTVPKTSHACLRMFNKSALRQRCQEEGVSVLAKDTQDGLARKLSAHLCRGVSSFYGPSTFAINSRDDTELDRTGESSIQYESS